MALTRKQFLELTVLVGGALCTGASGVFGAGCSSDDDAPTPDAGGDASTSTADASRTDSGTVDSGAADTGTASPQCRASITQNHGHKITIPIEDLDSKTAKTYSIIGASDHDHQVTFEPNELADLKAGVSVKKTSTDGGTSHDHEVTVLCV